MKESKLILYQETFPIYRKEFIDLLYQSYGSRLTLKLYGSIGIDVKTDSFYQGWVLRGGRQFNLVGKLKLWTGDIFRDFFTYAKFVYPAFSNNLSIFAIALISIFYRRDIYYWGHFRSGVGEVGSVIRIAFFLLSGRYIFYTETEMKDFLNVPFFYLFKSRVNFIGNAINLSEINKYRSSYVVENRNRAILFIGRNTPKAKFNQLLCVAETKECADVTFHVVGVHKQELPFPSKVPGNVVFHGVLINEVEIANIANKCRVAFYPGSVGLSLIHAAAYGLPTVLLSGKSNHMPEFELVSKANCALLASSEDDFLSIIRNSVFDAEFDLMLNCLSQRCLEGVRVFFSPSTMRDRFINILERES